MAEIFDNDFNAEMLDFKDQMLRFVEIANQKFDGLTSDVRTNSFKLDRLENRLESGLNSVEERINKVETKLDNVSADLKLFPRQFNDVGSAAIKDHKRIDTLEERVDNLEAGVH